MAQCGLCRQCADPRLRLRFAEVPTPTAKKKGSKRNAFFGHIKYVWCIYKCATEGNENENVPSRDQHALDLHPILNEGQLLGRLDGKAIHIDLSFFYPLVLDQLLSVRVVQPVD